MDKSLIYMYFSYYDYTKIRYDYDFTIMRNAMVNYGGNGPKLCEIH